MIVLLAALQPEASGLQRAMDLVPERSTRQPGTLWAGRYHGRPVLLARTGMGRQRAEAAAAALLPRGRAAAVLSIGFSGGLDEQLGIGDLVLASALMAVTGDGEIEPAVYRPDQRLLRAVTVALEATPLRLLLGPTVTAPGILAAPAEKEALSQRTGAIAVDMESYWIARAASEQGLPFLALRAISDTQQDLLPALSPLLEADGSPRMGQLLAYLLQDPGSPAALLRLARKAGRARRALTTGVTCAIAAL